MKNWRDHIKRIVELILETSFCAYLLWLIFTGFISSPKAGDKMGAVLYLSCSVLLAIIISGMIYAGLLYISKLEKENEMLERESTRLRIMLETKEQGKDAGEEGNDRDAESKIKEENILG